MSDADGSFEICLHFISVAGLSVQVDERTTVRQLLVVCREYLGFPSDTWLERFQISHQGRPLHFSYNLVRFGVRAGAVLHVVVVP